MARYSSDILKLKARHVIVAALFVEATPTFDVFAETLKLVSDD